jgi:hypothetical protein
VQVKCDERPGECANCERLRLVCSGYSTASSAHPERTAAQYSETNRNGTEGRTKRKRTYRSCTTCRSSKIKCSGNRPTCLRCQQKKLGCVYEAGSEPAWAQRMASASAHPEGANAAADVLMHEPTAYSDGQSEASQPEQRRSPGKILHQSLGSATLPGEASSLSWYFFSALL